MRKLTQSTGYARIRAGMGLLYTAFGITILARTLHAFLAHPAATIPAMALSCALMGLGVLRFRDALARLRSSAS